MRERGGEAGGSKKKKIQVEVRQIPGFNELKNVKAMSKHSFSSLSFSSQGGDGGAARSVFQGN